MIWVGRPVGLAGGGQVGEEKYAKITCFIKALEIDPTNGSAWTNLGLAGGGQVGEKKYAKITPLLTSFTGSADVFWDETDTSGQGALTAGSTVTINFYPEGDTTGDTYYSGQAIVTGVTRSASFDGMVEASITLQGSGALTPSTV